MNDHTTAGHVLACDCGCTTFELHRRHDYIAFVCTRCGSVYVDDEGFGAA